MEHTTPLAATSTPHAQAKLLNDGQAKPQKNLMALTLQSEGALIGIAAILTYAHTGGSMWMFLALILVPDLMMLGYLFGKRAGALMYNVAHSYGFPVIIGAMAFYFDHALVLQLAMIWTAHIGLDRAIGYGLKYTSGFKDTHLGRV